MPSPSQTAGSRRGRPPIQAAQSHAAIMDAVYALLQEKSVRDLTLEGVAKQAKVGTPTLYRWWPSKAALVFAMFHERLATAPASAPAGTAEEVIRGKVRHLIEQFGGLFGKVMADLIAEGQHDPAVLHELYERHIGLRRAATAAVIEQGKATGEFRADADPSLLMDALFSPIYLRLLLKNEPLTPDYGEALVTQVLQSVRSPI